MLGGTFVTAKKPAPEIPEGVIESVRKNNLATLPTDSVSALSKKVGVEITTPNQLEDAKNKVADVNLGSLKVDLPTGYEPADAPIVGGAFKDPLPPDIKRAREAQTTYDGVCSMFPDINCTLCLDAKSGILDDFNAAMSDAAFNQSWASALLNADFDLLKALINCAKNLASPQIKKFAKTTAKLAKMGDIKMLDLSTQAASNTNVHVDMDKTMKDLLASPVELDSVNESLLNDMSSRSGYEVASAYESNVPGLSTPAMDLDMVSSNAGASSKILAGDDYARASAILEGIA